MITGLQDKDIRATDVVFAGDLVHVKYVNGLEFDYNKATYWQEVNNGMIIADTANIVTIHNIPPHIDGVLIVITVFMLLVTMVFSIAFGVIAATVLIIMGLYARIRYVRYVKLAAQYGIMIKR
jgi:hypothetical protein